MASPDHDKVSETVRQHDDRDCGESVGFFEQHMIERQYYLLGLEPELVGNFLNSVDGGAVDIGLAGFAEAAIMHVDAETAQEAFQSGRATIHVGGLDDLRDDEAGARFHRFSLARGLLNPADSVV